MINKKEWEYNILSKKVRMYKIAADGNCLYSALEFALNVLNLRKKLIQFIKQDMESQKIVLDIHPSLE